jgi:long-chain acyl-CoA synthetase
VEVRTEDGEILARGDNVMQGYFKNPEATAITLAEGWLHTGDLGELDSEGFLHISGRKKSVIVTSGGKKIYPEEVEIELMQCPLVAECIVCEGYDPGNGESLVRAVIVPNLEAVSKQLGKPESAISDSEMYSVMQTEVRRVCKSLASFKQIRQIDVQREELVKTTTRKVKRYLYVQAPPTRSIPT